MKRLKFIIGLGVMLFAITGHAQDYVEGKVVRIINTNSYLIERIDNGETISVKINDSKSLSEKDEKYKQGIEYLQSKVLNQKVYYTEENTEGEMLYVSIIYNCEENDGKVIKDVPCLTASFLDIEMIQQGYIEYTGENEFLKKNIPK